MITRLTIEMLLKIILLDLSYPAIPMSVFEVIKIGFMIVGFFFKNNVAIGPVVVLVSEKVDEVVKKIEDVKGENKQF